MPSCKYWFPRTCCTKHKKCDSREPGLFKLEFSGNEMISLCSKTYIVVNENETKVSCKGIQKRNLENPLELFRKVIKTGENHSHTNIGFRAKNNSISTYMQKREGFSYFYVKRTVKKIWNTYETP